MMVEMIESVYGAGFDVWNSIIGIAMELFTMSPKNAGSGNLYFIAHSLFLALRNISLPIAIVFFLIALIRETTSTPPDQQVRRFFNDAIKFGVIVGILYNLWTILGVIIDVTDAITSNLAGVGYGEDYKLSMAPNLHATLDTILGGTFWESLDDLKIWEIIKQLIVWFIGCVLALLAAVAFVIVVVTSSLSVLSSAFSRIIKPLILLPFSCITVAMGAGTGEADRVMWSYLKSLIGLLISGAFMVACVVLGAALGKNLISVSSVTSGIIAPVVLISVEACVVPIMIAGLVKGVDGMIGKFL